MPSSPRIPSSSAPALELRLRPRAQRPVNQSRNSSVELSPPEDSADEFIPHSRRGPEKQVARDTHNSGSNSFSSSSDNESAASERVMRRKRRLNHRLEKGRKRAKKEPSPFRTMEASVRLDSSRIAVGPIRSIDLTSGKPKLMVRTDLEMVHRNEPDPDDDCLFPVTSPTNPTWVEKMFRDENNPKKFDQKTWGTHLSVKVPIEEEDPAKIKRQRIHDRKLVKNLTREIEPRKDYKPSPFSQYLTARRYTPDELGEMPETDRYWLGGPDPKKYPDHIHHALFWTGEASIPKISEGHPGLPWSMARVPANLRAFVTERYHGLAEDNAMRSENDSILSPYGNGSSAQFANDPSTWNEKEQAFVHEPKLENARNHIFEMKLTNRKTGQVEKRDIITTGALDNAKPGAEARYSYEADEEQQHFRKHLTALELERRKQRQPSSPAVKPEPDSDVDMPDTEPLAVASQRAGSPNSEISVMSHTPSVESSVYNSDQESLFSDIPSEGNVTDHFRKHQHKFKKIYKHRGSNGVLKKLSKNTKVQQGLIHVFAREVQISHQSGSDILKKKLSKPAQLKKFQQYYQTQGPEGVVKLYTDPRITLPVIKLFARQNGIKFETGMDILRDAGVEQFAELYKQGSQAVVDHHNNPKINKGTVNRFARDNDIKFETGADILRADPQFEERYQQGAQAVVDHFNTPKINKDTVIKFAREKGIKFVTGMDILRDAGVEQFAELYKQGSQAVVDHHKNPKVTKDVVINFAEEKQIRHQS